MVEEIRKEEGATRLGKVYQIVKSTQCVPPQERTWSIWWEQLGDEVQKAFPNGYTYGNGMQCEVSDSTNITSFLGDTIHQNMSKMADKIRNFGYYQPEQRSLLGNACEIPRAFLSEIIALPFDSAAIAGRPDMACEALYHYNEIIDEGFEAIKKDPYNASGTTAALFAGSKGITKLKPNLKYSNAIKSCDNKVKEVMYYFNEERTLRPIDHVYKAIISGVCTTAYIMLYRNAAIALIENQYDAHKQIYPQPLLNPEELKNEGFSEKQCDTAENINKVVAFIYANNEHPYTYLNLKPLEDGSIELIMSDKDNKKSKTIQLKEDAQIEEISKRITFVLDEPENFEMHNNNTDEMVDFENIYELINNETDVDKGIIQKIMLSTIFNQQYKTLLKCAEVAPEEFHELQAKMSNEQLQAIVSILPDFNLPLEHFLKNNPRLEAAFYEHCFRGIGTKDFLIDSLPAPEKDKQTREDSIITAKTYKQMTGNNFKDDVEWELSFGDEDKVKMRCNLWQDYQ